MADQSPTRVNTVAAMQAWRAALPNGSVLGFVPTMGALHPGHGSLLHRARTECDFVVCSVFVNPTQFDNADDLAHYPSTLAADLALNARHGVDCVWTPSNADLYPHGYHMRITESRLADKLCGAHRPGHFDGVLTVVMKLLQIVAPQRAYFGEKDYQQLALVRAMVDNFFLPLTIVGCPTCREPDGLAMSSRNARLSPAQRAQAADFPRILHSVADLTAARAALQAAGFAVDYIEDWHDRRCAAVRLGDVRLIDNVPIPAAP
jgi:pantoate--beta-alanine ligase